MLEATIIEHAVVRLGGTRVTRAHVALARSNRFRQLLDQAAARVASCLSKELGKPVTIHGRLLPSTSRGVQALADPAAYALFELGTRGTMALLELETPIAGAFVDALAGGPAAASAPYEMTPAEKAAFAFSCLLAIRSLREDPEFEKAFAPRLVRIPDSAREAGQLLDGIGTHAVVEIKLKIAETEGLGRLLVPSSAVTGVCATQAAEPQRPLTTRTTLALTAWGPGLSLDSEQLEDASRGDVVVMPGAKLVEGRYQGPAVLRSRAFRIDGAFGPGGFVIEKTLTASSTEEIMQPNNPARPARPGAPSPSPKQVPAPKEPVISPLPIEIGVELARISIPLADLANTEPGTILPLHVGPTAAVVLRIGDKVFARAELVDIEGELGARILGLES